MDGMIRTGARALLIAMAVASLTAAVSAQTGSEPQQTVTPTKQETLRLSTMQRVLVRRADGSTTVMWVRKPTDTVTRGGARVSSSISTLSAGDDSLDAPTIRLPLGFGSPDRPRPEPDGDPSGDPIVGDPAPPPPPPGGGDGGGGIGGGGGGGVPSGEIIAPGSGFNGPTAQPATVGNPGDYGYDARAIARWDVVPDQIFESTFNIGVVAFHMAGMDRVDFIAEDGTPVAIGEPTLNPRTGVVEYWGTLQASDFQDGRVEVRAIAYPLKGEPRVLEPLVLWADAHGGLEQPEFFVNPNSGNDNGNGTRTDPFRTLGRALIEFKRLVTPGAGDGPAASGTITLMREGFYALPVYNSSWVDIGPYIGEGNVNNDRWITIRADQGLDRDNVVIGLPSRSNVRCRVDKLAFHNVSIDVSNIIQMYTEGAQNIWFDQTRLWNPNGQLDIAEDAMNLIRDRQFGGKGFSTDSLYTDSLYAFSNHFMVRGCHAERISGDVFQNSLFVVNSTVNDVNGNLSTWHSDLFQYFGDFEDIIVYGIEASNIIETQNFFLDHYESTFNNCAFVNVAIDNVQNNIVQSQLNSAQNHMLFYHIANPGQQWTFRDDFGPPQQFVGHNVVFRNDVIQDLRRGNWTWTGLPAGVEVANCHFVEGEAHGTNASTGPVGVDGMTGSEFTYTGSAVGSITQTGEAIPDLVVPDWTYGTGTSPNKGAFPFAQGTVAGN